MSSYGAAYGYAGTSVSAASCIRGPTARMNPFSQIGAKTTRSCRIFWIWCKRSSRFLRSSSLAWRWNRSSTSGRTVGVAALFGGDPLDARGRVTACPLGTQHDAADLLLGPGRQEGGPLHRPHARADADRREIAGDRLGHREVGRVRREVAGVEAVRVARFHHELLGALGIVGVRVDRQRELHVTRDDVAGDPREAELLGLVQSLAVDRHAGGEAHAPVVPGRLRIPLLGEVEEEDGVGADGRQLEPGGLADVLSNGAA